MALGPGHSVAIDYYKNHCGGVSSALSEMYNQLQGETMNQAELSKLQTSAALVVALGDKADLCQKLKPDVDNLARFAEAVPVKDNVSDTDDDDTRWHTRPSRA
jgi:hypothetical protein